MEKHEDFVFYYDLKNTANSLPILSSISCQLISQSFLNFDTFNNKGDKYLSSFNLASKITFGG